jgi:uncharacterized protein (DUF2147 family)
MRLSVLPFVGAAALLNAGPASALSSQDVYGVWRHPDNGSLMEVYPCDGGICAKAVTVQDDQRKDGKNPDPALRGRPVAGIEIWRHAKETAPLQWSGSGYNPLDGVTLYGTLRLTGETALVIASCNLNVMPCLDRTWTKVLPETAKAAPAEGSQPRTGNPQVSQDQDVQPQIGQPLTGPVQASQAQPRPAQASQVQTGPVQSSPVQSVPAQASQVQAGQTPAGQDRAGRSQASEPQANREQAAREQTGQLPVTRPEAARFEVGQPPRVSEPREAPAAGTNIEAKAKQTPPKSEKRKGQTEVRANRARDPNGYSDLPHIHVGR